MKIDFGNKQPTITSLRARVSETNDVNKYQGFIVGSQTMLRARLKRHTADTDKINILLDKKDIDIRFEPVDDTQVDMPALRSITEKYNQSLSKKKKKELPLHWLSYYSLPANEVKHGKKNKLDPSVQRCKIKPCMNIDIKADFTGEIHYLNDQNKHDFEVSYLEENTIILYDLDTYNMTNLDSTTKLAFMLKKCTNPEVKDFGSRLDFKSADFVKQLFENKNNRDKIMSIIRDHYDLDTVQVEADIIELYTRSIQIEIDIVNSAITETKITVDSMLFTIAKVNGKNNGLQSELDNIMSISSGAGFEKIQEQLKSVKHFKDKICNMFEEAKNSLPHETSASNRMIVLQLRDKYSATKSEEKKPEPKPTKIKKISSSPAPRKEISPDEFERVLQEAKANSAPLTPSQEFKALVLKHEAVINSLPGSGLLFRTSNPAALPSFTEFAVAITILTVGIHEESVRDSFYTFVDFYHTLIQQYSKDSSNNASDIQNHLESLGSPPVKKNHRITVMIDFLKTVLIEDQSSFAENALKKTTNFVKNYVDSPTQDIAVLTRSTFDIVASLEKPIEACVGLIKAAAYSELKQRVLNSKRNGKTMTLLRHLVALIALCELEKYYHSLDDTIAVDLVKALIKVSFEHEKSMGMFSEIYCDEFIIIAARALHESDNRLEEHTNYAMVQTIKSIFYSPMYSRKDDIVTYATKIYEKLSYSLKTQYNILYVCTPTVPYDLHDTVTFNPSDKHDVLASTLFKLSNDGAKKKEFKDIVSTLRTRITKLSKRLHSEGNYVNAMLHKRIAICLTVFEENLDLIYQPCFHQRYTKKLLENKEFAFLLDKTTVSQVVAHAYNPTPPPPIQQGTSSTPTETFKA